MPSAAACRRLGRLRRTLAKNSGRVCARPRTQVRARSALQTGASLVFSRNQRQTHSLCPGFLQPRGLSRRRFQRRPRSGFRPRPHISTGRTGLWETLCGDFHRPDLFKIFSRLRVSHVFSGRPAVLPNELRKRWATVAARGKSFRHRLS